MDAANSWRFRLSYQVRQQFTTLPGSFSHPKIAIQVQGRDLPSTWRRAGYLTATTRIVGLPTVVADSQLVLLGDAQIIFFTRFEQNTTYNLKFQRMPWIDSNLSLRIWEAHQWESLNQ